MPADAPSAAPPPDVDRRVARWAFAATGARALTGVVAVASVPILLSTLGREAFGAWAVAMGGATLLGALDLGAGPTLIRFLTPAIRRGDAEGVDRILSSGAFPLLGVYATTFAALALAADPIAALLRIPDTAWMTGGALLRVCGAGLVLQAFLSFLIAPVLAAERFVLAAATNVLATAFAHGSGWTAAALTGRLDAAVVAYWTANTLGLAVGAAVGRSRAVRWRLRPASVDRATLRDLFAHGAFLQVSQVCQIVNFQFAKLVVAASAGTAAVPPYETAERAFAGLRGFPIAATNVLLPEVSARQASGDGIGRLYERMTRGAALAIVVFLVVPVALSPALFRAWTGSVGAEAVPLFALLLPGIALNLLAAPVSIVVQGMGRPSLQAAAAAASLVMNVVLSLALVGPYGVAGAAAGTTLAMSISSIGYLAAFHRSVGLPVGPTIRGAARAALPLLPLAALLWVGAEGAVAAFGESRIALAASCAALAAAFAAAAAVVVRRAGCLDDLELRTLAATPLVGRLFR